MSEAGSSGGEDDAIVFERRDRTDQIIIADQLLRGSKSRSSTKSKKRNKMDHHYKRRKEIKDKPKFMDLSREEQEIHYPGRMSLSQVLAKKRAVTRVMSAFRMRVSWVKSRVFGLANVVLHLESEPEPADPDLVAPTCADTARPGPSWPTWKGA